MKTIKIKTPTNTNYCICLNGFFFCVRKNTNGFWVGLSYASNMLHTDEYILAITDGHSSKKTAIESIISIMQTEKPDFFHNIK